MAPRFRDQLELRDTSIPVFSEQQPVRPSELHHGDDGSVQPIFESDLSRQQRRRLDDRRGKHPTLRGPGA